VSELKEMGEMSGVEWSEVRYEGGGFKKEAGIKLTACLPALLNFLLLASFLRLPCILHAIYLS
jgi:hypothetical protein